MEGSLEGPLLGCADGSFVGLLLGCEDGEFNADIVVGIVEAKVGSALLNATNVSKSNNGNSIGKRCRSTSR